MLYVIHQNKFGRNIQSSGTPINWKAVFKGSEDSLTSSIFQLLFYLPADLFWQILSNACYGNKLPDKAGKIVSKEFWPHWNCEGTQNTNFIEPDVFIRFEYFDLIIEAKRYDYSQQQDCNQWRDQLLAYYNEYGIDPQRQVYYIALGGVLKRTEEIESINTMLLERVPVIICKWKRILQQVHALLEREHSTTTSVLYILQDLILAFRMHGFLTGILLNTMPVGIVMRERSFAIISKLNRLLCFKPFPENIRNINSNHILKLYGTALKK